MSVSKDQGWQIICPNCKELVDVGDRYCRFCGARCDRPGVEYHYDFEWRKSRYPELCYEPTPPIYGPPWAFEKRAEVYRVKFVCPNCGTKFCTDREGSGSVTMDCPVCRKWSGTAEYGDRRNK